MFPEKHRRTASPSSLSLSISLCCGGRKLQIQSLILDIFPVEIVLCHVWGFLLLDGPANRDLGGSGALFGIS